MDVELGADGRFVFPCGRCYSVLRFDIVDLVSRRLDGIDRLDPKIVLHMGFLMPFEIIPCSGAITAHNKGRIIILNPQYCIADVVSLSEAER